MKQDFGALGKLSVQCLMEHLNGTQGGSHRITPTFIERESVLVFSPKDKSAPRKPLLIS
jgi:hypothetical protein